MKNSIIVILISAFAFFAVSCGKMKKQESKKEEKKTEVRIFHPAVLFPAHMLPALPKYQRAPAEYDIP